MAERASLLEQTLSDLARATPYPARTILILSLASSIGIGIARFGYSLVLPDMRDSLGWSYSAAGFLNTVNAAGYLIGALAAAALARRIGLGATLRYGVVACVISLVLCALTANFILLTIARLVAGIGAALAFIAGSALSAQIAQAYPQRSSFLLGLYYGGAGIGIALSGFVAPTLLQIFGPGSWPITWAAFAAISLAFTLVLMLTKIEPPQTDNDDGDTQGIALSRIWIFLFAYFCFGAGYISYMTFMIAYVRDAGGGAVAQGLFWMLIGFGTFLSPWIWARLLQHGQTGMAMAVLLALNAFAAGLPLLGNSNLLLGISAFVFGAVFFAVVGATTAFARFNYPQPAWPKAIAVMSIVFGMGQILGPIVTGAISDTLGSLSPALIVSAVTLAIGAIASAFQNRLKD